jgi:hypothetical protein
MSSDSTSGTTTNAGQPTRDLVPMFVAGATTSRSTSRLWHRHGSTLSTAPECGLQYSHVGNSTHNPERSARGLGHVGFDSEHAGVTGVESCWPSGLGARPGSCEARLAEIVDPTEVSFPQIGVL